MRNLIDDIEQYTLYLRDTLHYSVSIHAANDFMSPFLNRLAPLRIHNNAYCLLVKSSHSAWDQCIRCQSKVVAKCEKGPFSGVCYAGLGEFVFPIRNEAGVIGFVSVSGYRLDEPLSAQKRAAFAESFGFSQAMLDIVYGQATNAELPDMAQLQAVIMPLCHMLELLESRSGTGRRGPLLPESVFGNILVYVERNFAENFTVNDVAAACHCSVSYVSHTFKEKTGAGISSYVNRLRIRHSIPLLENTTLSVQEISGRVGFEDANYFSNVFKKIVGLSPSAYRSAGFVPANGNAEP